MITGAAFNSFDHFRINNRITERNGMVSTSMILPGNISDQLKIVYICKDARRISVVETIK